MTSFDQIVAADLAAVATDSQQHIGTFDAFVPAPRAQPAPRPKDPIRLRVNRIATLAAGGTMVACAVGFAKATIREPFYVSQYDAYDVRNAPIYTNVWFLSFAAVALVATAFLLAHRIASRTLEGSRDWRTRAQRLGDLAFGVTAVVFVVGWFLVMLDGDTAWSLWFFPHGIDVWRGHSFDIRGNCWLVLAGGLACSLTARAIAVRAARSVSDRWSGAALALCARLAGITALVTVCVMPEFGRNGGKDLGWGGYDPSLQHHMSFQINRAMHQVQYGWAYWRREWFDPDQLRVVFGAAIAMGFVALVTSVCIVERYTKRRSQLLAVLEHGAVPVLVLTITFVTLVRFFQEDVSVGPIYDTTAAALIVLAISMSLRSRRASLKT